MRSLVVGISSPMGQLVAHRLHDVGHQVVGIDRRPWHGAPEWAEVHNVDIRKRPATDVFRAHRPELVVHLGTVTHFEHRREERSRINLQGTRAVLEACSEHGTRHFVFVSRHTVYGAAPDAPLYRSEHEPPLAVTTFPDLADLVAADLFASSAAWRQEAMETCVLRMVYALGPSARGTLADFLRGARVPMVLGFDPLFQFMHEHDAADAIAAAALARVRGVFNVAGPSPLPLSWLARGVGRGVVPLPEVALPYALGRFGMPRLPRGAITHLKHPVVVDDKVFRKETGWKHQIDEIATMAAFQAACPVPGESQVATSLAKMSR